MAERCGRRGFLGLLARLACLPTVLLARRMGDELAPVIWWHIWTIEHPQGIRRPAPSPGTVIAYRRPPSYVAAPTMAYWRQFCKGRFFVSLGTSGSGSPITRFQILNHHPTVAEVEWIQRGT